MKSKLNLPNNINRLMLFVTPRWAGWIGLCNLGSKVKIMCLSRLLNAHGLHLGPGCVVRGSKFIHFGRDDVSFSEGVHITCIDRISIGRGVLFGSRVYVSDHNHGIYKGPLQSHPQEPPTQRKLGGGGVVEIGDHVWIGDNALIVWPITIGRGSIVGANSVVRADVPEFTMVGGIPARALKRFEQATGQWEKS